MIEQESLKPRLSCDRSQINNEHVSNMREMTRNRLDPFYFIQTMRSNYTEDAYPCFLRIYKANIVNLSYQWSTCSYLCSTPIQYPD